jgi:cystathionine gamma-synthase
MKSKPTQAVHAGMQPDPSTGAVMQPIHLATTFERDVDGGYARGFSYSRENNPNRLSLEVALTALENGSSCCAFPSGMAAAFAVFSTLQPGAHVLVADDCYYGVGELLRGHLQRWGVSASFVDLSDPAATRSALRPETQLIWAESPSNPMLKICDLQALAEIAQQAGARLAVDNTWPTPLGQRPLDLGADFVAHSTTKHLSGHSDVMGGAVVVREDGEALQRMRDFQNHGGVIPAPFDCWLTRRGIFSLAARLQLHTQNAAQLADALHAHPGVSQVHYPGLADDPGHELASKQMLGFGGMLSFQVPGGAAQAMAVAASLELFVRATSLGGPESLVEHRASVEGPHSKTPSGLLRLAVGLESAEDLIEDLHAALAANQSA